MTNKYTDEDTLRLETFRHRLAVILRRILEDETETKSNNQKEGNESCHVKSNHATSENI